MDAIIDIYKFISMKQLYIREFISHTFLFLFIDKVFERIYWSL